MIVVDTNAIGYLFLSSESSILAERTLQKDRDWAAPVLWRSELRTVSSYEVLRLSSESQCSAYDCEFIAVAKDLKVPLVTADRQVLHAFPDVAVSLKAFCE